ncbi:MAG: tRNA (adenosine(37)-N6)-dimethylallyltransferase MiaA [Clostridia bacterium]|nr:tRNA (adenosine(37)-N6)-dimethylallyltransferase MiaA [Clostridia bacterium]MBQ7048848.1 tRNA (adenosine(37)-N6)-dimethylallyltransferase MiaA [Clostridia bacterium]
MMKIIAVVGATATGKSGLSVKLAKALDGEIISGDSAQVYRGMDIGTAKIRGDEMQGIPHHLIDILDIEEPFSAGLFAELGAKAAEDIVSRGKLPIIAGGTGLYVDALTGKSRLSPTADSDPAVRNELMEKARVEGAQSLHAYLASIDPAAASEIHPNNVKRVARAIEIFLVTGKTKTELNSTYTAESPYDRLLLLLDCPDRELLYDRIEERVDIMLEEGLEAEAYSLWQRGLGNTPTASAAIGYKELFPYFEGQISFAEAVAQIKQATRNYAKRQITYFKRMEGSYPIDIRQGKDTVYKTALDKCFEFLEK